MQPVLAVSSVLVDALKANEAANVLDVCTTSEATWAVAVHDYYWGSYPIYHMKKESEDPTWKAIVLCEDILVPGTSGPGSPHSTELKADSKGRLLVFGAVPFSMYIEGFDLRDGTPAFRFSTLYLVEHP